MSTIRCFPSGTVLFLLFLTVVNVGKCAELISAGRDKVPKPGASLEPVISGDGKFVVFSSSARLLPADKNSVSDVYVKDRETQTLRLVSDERGGDQPVISANGRFIVFRVLEEFPKLRLADIESAEAPRTISYPFGSGRSFRSADSPVISPDGRFVGFSLRPVSGLSGTSDPQFCVNDTFNPDRLNASKSNINGNDGFQLNTLGRSAMALGGDIFFFETTDRLLPADTNDDQDIYMATPGSSFVRRISATEVGLPEEGSVRDPVSTVSGNTVFFISERQLRSTDVDGRATIYRSTSADIFATPVPIPTPVRPIALSRQATSDGQFLVFLGQGKTGAAQPFILNVTTGKVVPLAPSAVTPMGAPVISADNSTVAFASASPLSGQDGNWSPDIYVVRNPNPGSQIEAPIVTLTNPPGGFVGVEGSPISFLANVVSPDSPALFIAIEVDGKEVFRVNGGTLNQGIFVNRGVHKVRAVTLNAAGVAGRSEEIQVTVRVSGNELALHGVTDLTRSLQSDGFTSFSGTIRIDNKFATARGPFQVVLVERPTAMRWEFFGFESLVPAEAERVLQISDKDPVPGNSLTEADFAGIASPPRVIGDGFQGQGSTVVVRLRELVGGSWLTRSEFTILEIRPRLDEDTPGPNGGIPVPGSDPGAEPFDPQLLQDLQIQGAPKVAGNGSTLYKAVAIFNSGSAPCTPTWQVTNGGAFAKIAPSGLLKASNVSAPLTITIKATFNGLTKTMPVTITPTSPKISVKASEPFADESGTPGSFRILRSSGINSPLDVSYEISGKAIPGDDFVTLSGTATISAGSSSVIIPVTPLNDATPEGRERVTLSLTSQPQYRLAPARVATVTIEDDEAVQQGQPDVMISRARKTVGEFEFGFDSVEQQLFANAAKNAVAVFNCRFVNRTAAAETFTIEGSGDFLGFKVRYFDGTTDVTADVVAGTFTFNGLEAGGEARLTLKITPTAAAPRGSMIRCVVRARNANGLNDAAEAAVKRIR